MKQELVNLLIDAGVTWNTHGVANYLLNHGVCVLPCKDNHDLCADNVMCCDDDCQKCAKRIYKAYCREHNREK